MIDIAGIAQEIADELLWNIEYSRVLDRLPGYLTESETEVAADQIIHLIENATVELGESE